MVAARSTRSRSGTAQRLEETLADLGSSGFSVVARYGVPEDEDMTALLDAEERAGATDPYRWLASQIHVVALRDGH